MRRTRDRLKAAFVIALVALLAMTGGLLTIAPVGQASAAHDPSTVSGAKGDAVAVCSEPPSVSRPHAFRSPSPATLPSLPTLEPPRLVGKRIESTPTVRRRLEAPSRGARSPPR